MSIELWGGLECTVNRIHSEYFDQIARSGHQSRIADLDLIAQLGIQKLRYPVLWERTTPDGMEDWSWPDERLGRLRQLRITPIVGLLHHGSGPPSTSLLDPDFPNKFSAFAGAVAARYPWVEFFTPINEPLTTARFSALYGHWYPHVRDSCAFVRALVIQCRAIAQAMKEIRMVNSRAQLVQTEDLGRIFSTRRLWYQAEFENQRRWLTFDLLCGHVDRCHPLWAYLLGCGIPIAELLWFRENPCAPDIFGMNHYVTSDRFLDDRIERYPQWAHGGNGRDRYADVEAVRVDLCGPLGFQTRLKELWARYRRPVALTEVHLGCTVDEQIRWFYDAWDAARRVHQDGAEIKAVTPWALFGSFDWNSLLTKQDGYYEPGVFDIRYPAPRPTQLAEVILDAGRGLRPRHPALAGQGWWHRPERACYLGQISAPESLAAV